jgi:hypothetical protein
MHEATPLDWITAGFYFTIGAAIASTLIGILVALFALLVLHRGLGA